MVAKVETRIRFPNWFALCVTAAARCVGQSSRRTFPRLASQLR